MRKGLRRLRWWAAVCTCAVTLGCSAPPEPELRSVSGVAQGTSYSLQWVGGAAETEILSAAEAELARIDALVSNYRADSVLERFNAMRSTEPAELPAELVALLRLAKRIHMASDGCFDPTVRPLVSAWGFDSDEPAVPSQEALDAARAAVGLDKLELLDATHARKTVAELQIDMASLGQGYTAGRLAAVLQERGSTTYLAEIGGEIVARGTKPDGAAWRIGVENPIGDNTPALRLPPSSTAVITSGSYRQYFESGGRRFGHILDARSGWPVDHDLLSVTVVGEDAAEAAAWATALLCLGPAEARAVADREHVAALFWIGGDGDATLERSRALPPDLLEDPR